MIDSNNNKVSCSGKARQNKVAPMGRRPSSSSSFGKYISVLENKVLWKSSKWKEGRKKERGMGIKLEDTYVGVVDDGVKRKYLLLFITHGVVFGILPFCLWWKESCPCYEYYYYGCYCCKRDGEGLSSWMKKEMLRQAIVHHSFSLFEFDIGEKGESKGICLEESDNQWFQKVLFI